MTPERLQEIRRYHEEEVEVANDSEGFPGELTEEVHIIQDLLDYIDLLHEDLRITRAERDAEKKKNLALRKGQGTYHQENK